MTPKCNLPKGRKFQRFSARSHRPEFNRASRRDVKISENAKKPRLQTRILRRDAARALVFKMCPEPKRERRDTSNTRRGPGLTHRGRRLARSAVVPSHEMPATPVKGIGAQRRQNVRAPKSECWSRRGVSRVVVCIN